MPPPWGWEQPKLPQPPLHIVDRAMTLKQLRKMHDLVKRLCKVGLLRYPGNSHNLRLGREGERVKWTQVSQHEITSEIIKNIIPQAHSCSWVEMLARGISQPRRFFCSHSWSEPFRDFIVTIERHALQVKARPRDGYWICVYANDQWMPDLGELLEQSPFFQALRGAEMTVMFLDKKCDVLCRLWCVFEAFSSVRTLGQRLEVWTPLGCVGSSLVSSGPMITALETFDVAKAAASNPCDRRQILNHILNVPEMTGLMFATGGKVIDSSKPEGAYESEMLDSRSSDVAVLNEMVWEAMQSTLNDARGVARRRNILANSDSQLVQYLGLACTHTFKIDDIALRGITLEQLRTFANILRSGMDEVAASMTTHAQIFEMLDNGVRQSAFDSALSPCSYVEYIAKELQPPDYFVSYSSDMLFKEFMDGIEWHAEARQLTDTTVYFIATFAYSVEESEQMRTSSALLDHPSVRAIRDHAEGLALMLSDHGSEEEDPLHHLWPVFEAHTATACCKSFDIISGTGALATSKPFPDGSWEFGDFNCNIARALLKFNVAHCRVKTESHLRTGSSNCSLAEVSTPLSQTTPTNSQASRRFRSEVISKETQRLLCEIAGIAETERPPKKCPGYDSFNQMMRMKAVGPLLREASLLNNPNTVDVDAVVHACPDFRFDDSPWVCGVLGDTPLHSAAAAGNCEMASRLLALHMNPNSRDLDGETPLHYAALTGQADAIALLLKERADPHCRSHAMETPLQVAQQNPAYFLGIDTGDVTNALRQRHTEVEDVQLEVGEAVHRTSKCCAIL